MTLNNYIKKLNALKKEGYGNLTLIYSIDEEGNEFKDVFYAPSAGTLDDDGYFIVEESKEKTHICIN